MLTKTTTLLQWDPLAGAYHSVPDEPGDRYHYLEVDPDVRRDLGQPETLTVTIEPGDKLNEAE